MIHLHVNKTPFTKKWIMKSHCAFFIQIMLLVHWLFPKMCIFLGDRTIFCFSVVHSTHFKCKNSKEKQDNGTK